MIVEDGQRHFGAGFPEYVQGRLVPRAARLGLVLRTEIAPGEPIRAYVNHNRWLAHCPDCGGSDYVWLDAPLLMCSSCWNGMVGGAWRRVWVPEDWREIEAVLRMRPIPQVRNWAYPETVADLRRENAQHGLAEVA